MGGQVKWAPTDSINVIANQYVGADTLNTPDRIRMHTDDSVMVKYYENQDKFISKAAASLTLDAGAENGGGVQWWNQYFLGAMAYNRVWFLHDKFGLTVGGGAINNPGRYLVLVPPINGANAFSGTPYFSANPGDQYAAWDGQVTLDYMPSQHITWRLEYNHRQASVPYFAGSGGMTPPGGNQGAPGSNVANWTPDLANTENRIALDMMIKI
jgi:hypothetical protein